VQTVIESGRGLVPIWAEWFDGSRRSLSKGQSRWWDLAHPRFTGQKFRRCVRHVKNFHGRAPCMIDNPTSCFFCNGTGISSHPPPTKNNTPSTTSHNIEGIYHDELDQKQKERRQQPPTTNPPIVQTIIMLTTLGIIHMILCMFHRRTGLRAV
jgi:hypothetical protein